MTDFFTKLKSLSNRNGRQGSLNSGSRTGSRSEASPRKNSQPDRQNRAPASLVEQAKHSMAKLGLRPSPGQNSDPPPARSIKQPLYQKWWAWALVGAGFSLGGLVIAAETTIVSIRRELPNTANTMQYVRTGTLTIKASDGTVLQQTGPATRDKIALQDMPKQLSQAFIASEDDDFYTHDGVDYRAIVRALYANLTAGEVVEGGSTITQQLARIVFLDQERSLERKLKEALLAQKMEQELSKDQILEQYLNLVYLGSSAYGVADAAWIYFSKSVNQLSLGEMAMIAGLAPAPSAYSPLVNPDLARQRRNIVLQRMVDAGYITAAQRDGAMAEELALKPGAPKNLDSKVPYFTSYIQQQLPQYVSPEDIELGGLTVETTLNPQWQEEAQKTINYAIRNYGPYEGFGQASLVAIDPRTGEIKALVGGDDFTKSQFNRATQAQRQPGSTFKMFVYSTAIAAGFSPYTTYMDAKLVVDGYEPQNYGKRFRGSVTLRDALSASINVVAVKTLIDVGFDPVIEMAKRMGIKSELLPAYSLALGSSEVNLLELTSAYGTLANQGNHLEAHGITRILDRFGNVIYEAKFQPERAIDAESAAVMSWMLEDVVNGGTGGAASLPDRPVAGKTGTSEKQRDLWFVGYIPQLVTGIWLGNDDNSPTYGASATAAQTWRDFMYPVTEKLPVEEFPELPPLGEWEGTIKAQPVKPNRLYESDYADNSGSDGGYSDQESYESYDSGYSSYSSDEYYEDPAPAESAPASSGEPAAETAPPAPSEPAPAAAEAAPIAEPPPAEPAPAAPVEAPPPPAAVEAPPPPATDFLPPLSAPGQPISIPGASN